MKSEHAGIYRRWQAQAGIQTPETLGEFVKGVVMDAVHMDGDSVRANALVAIGVAALSAFENATEPIDYDAAIGVIERVKTLWVECDR